MAALGFLDRDRTLAGPGFNRWLVPPAALAVHLCIGQVYALSVFSIPFSRLLGISHSAPGDWSFPLSTQVFNVAIFMLGMSAALFGAWLERAGPRRAMFYSALCFGGGFFIAAFGIHLHQVLLTIFGYGVVGGIGLGLGYISPVSTLIKWFPDRPGMATGMAIMGFGGGALIGSPLAVTLMDHFRRTGDAGVAPTFLVMGAVYLALMLFGCFLVRVPPPDYQPAGYVPAKAGTAHAAGANVDAAHAVKTPQFWLLWGVLFLNVTAGFGVLATASPMIQEMFPGVISAQAASGFVGLLSLFNLVGRFSWSSLSDRVGRKGTYAVYFALGAVLYALIPTFGHLHNVALFVLTFGIILSMYGGGFATMPAYLRDLFGTLQVGAIHGRVLTAWSLAAIAGPNLVTFIRQFQIEHGVAKADAYSTTLYVMAGLLALGFFCNLLVKPVDVKFHNASLQAGEGKAPSREPTAGQSPRHSSPA